MNSKGNLVPTSAVETEEIKRKEEALEVGQWYWYDGELCCITHVGSNYVRITGVNESYTRVHFDQIEERLTREVDADSVIGHNVQDSKEKVNGLMGRVKQITSKLGVSPRLGIEAPQNETRALSTLSGDVESYQTALVRAKDEELPAIFKEIEEANKELALWMQADMLPLKAEAERLQGCIETLQGRIFNVTLYAGLTEQVVCVRDGDQASFDDKLHIMQRRCYMDEECLVDYQAGGMDFKSIEKFDEWISKERNLNRILPFPRCIVAMRVRRTSKDRSRSDRDMAVNSPILKAFIDIQLEQLDKLTFLYIRNGDQLYRMNCDLEFGEMIFPDREEQNLNRPMMFKKDFSRIQMITRDDYEVRVDQYKERKRKREQWEIDSPYNHWKKTRKENHDDSKWAYNRENPHYKYNDTDPEQEWTDFNPQSVHYDDVVADIQARVTQYNRIAVIVQGLYDRSPILHPHPPVKTWTGEGFEQAIELVYDRDGALNPTAEPPCFEKYAAELRKSIKRGSILIGQEEVWQEHVQEIEAQRRESDWRCEHKEVHSWWTPNGNPGPGFMSRCTSAGKKATFRWHRERQRSKWRDGQHYGDPIATTFSVPMEHLFHVDAYRPGDYVKFFEDPRTREQYIEWAPCMLAAEDFHAGKREPKEPVE